MEEYNFNRIFPGETFELLGEKILTTEGKMSGNVTLRVITCKGEIWLNEIIGVEKPEWEWMLGKIIPLSPSLVTEQFDKKV